MNLNGWKRKQPINEPIKLNVTGKLADKIRALYAEANLGCAFGGRTSLEQYIIEIIDSFVVEHRSNRLRDDPSRYWERNGDDAEHVMD